jgi:hypothetical protein
MYYLSRKKIKLLNKWNFLENKTQIMQQALKIYLKFLVA